MNTVSLRKILLVAPFLLALGGFFASASLLGGVSSKLDKMMHVPKDRFLLADFEDDVLHNKKWLTEQSNQFVGFIVSSQGGNGGTDKLSLGVGEGRNGGNALIVESLTPDAKLPGFWIYKAKNNLGEVARIYNQEGYALPRGKKANRLSFWIKFEEGFRSASAAATPPAYPNHQNLHVGTYHFDPAQLGKASVVESHNWHFYFQVFLRHDMAGADWINVVVNQFPQHQRGRKALPPENPTRPYGNFWELLTRVYVEAYPYLSSVSYPVKMWVDDIELLEVDERNDIDVSFEAFENGEEVGVIRDQKSSYYINISNSSQHEVCGSLAISAPHWLGPKIYVGSDEAVDGNNFCLGGSESKVVLLTLSPPSSAPENSLGSAYFSGVSFIANDQMDSGWGYKNVSFSSPYVERRWYPETGSHDAVVSGSFFRARLK